MKAHCPGYRDMHGMVISCPKVLPDVPPFHVEGTTDRWCDECHAAYIAVVNKLREMGRLT